MNIASYHHAARKAAIRAQWASAFLSFVLLMQIPGAIVRVLQLRHVGSDFGSGAIWLWLTWLWIASMIRTWLAFARPRRARLAAMKNRELYRAPKSALAEIRADITQFASTLLAPSAKRMGLELWIARNCTLSPSVFYFRGCSCVCIPLGFVSLYRSNRSVARAMLAHEIGHIAQRDTDLWARVQVIGGTLYDSLIKLLKINIWAGIFSSVWSWVRVLVEAPAALQMVSVALVINLFIGGLIIGIYLLLFVWAKDVLRSARHQSEYLADMAAAVCVGRQSCCEALLSCIDIEEPTFEHPSPVQRVTLVLETAAHSTAP